MAFDLALKIFTVEICVLITLLMHGHLIVVIYQHLHLKSQNYNGMTLNLFRIVNVAHKQVNLT